MLDEKVKRPINLKKQLWDPQKPQLDFGKKLYTSALKISRDLKKFHQSKVVPKPSFSPIAPPYSDSISQI